MLYFCIFDSFRVKSKGKERSALGPEIKFLDCDTPAVHVADNGPGRASSKLVLGWGPNRAGPARPMPTSSDTSFPKFSNLHLYL